MLAVFDVETTPIKGGEKPKFILGRILIEGRKSSELFYKKEEMWNRIIELGIAEYKRDKVLTIYAHNITFDFFQIADLKCGKIKYFCHRPFIASYVHEGKEVIKFLDTMSIYRMSLAKMAELLNMKKWETPLELLEKPEELDFLQKKQIADYCEQDCKITLKGITHIKEMLKKEGINVRRLYTINQIAINYLINVLRKEEASHILLNYNEGQVWPTKRDEEIKEAYRGGRNEAFRTGSFHGVNYLDINSLYPWCLTEIKIPDLRTETKIENPLKIKNNTEELFEIIGVSKCLIYNKSDEIGLLPIRTKIGNYYPKKGTYLYGSWTHIELKEAIRRGYEIINIEHSILYDEGKNPFKETMKKLYELRKRGGFEKYFYKMMMNAGIGKMAQTKSNIEIEVIDIEKVEEYIKKGYEIVDGQGTNMILEKKPINTPKKKYYMPIIPTLVNAKARVEIYKNYKKLPKDALIYSDTDSIMFQGNYKHLFNIGEELGQFKIEVENGYHKNYGKKTYRINEEIKIGGIRKKDTTKEDFDRGEVLNTKMRTIATSQSFEEIGGFESNIENLKEREEKLKEIEKKLKEQKFFIDENTKINEKSMEVLRKRIESTT